MYNKPKRNHATARFNKVENKQSVYKVVYHQTVVYKLVGNVQILNSGGYKTPTTKQRINAELLGSGQVYQKNFEWFYYHKGIDYNFTDNMMLDINGKPLTNTERIMNKKHFVLVLIYASVIFFAKAKKDDTFTITSKLKDSLTFEERPSSFPDSFSVAKVGDYL